MAGVVERLERHTPGHRPVAYDRNDPLVTATRVPGTCHTQRARYRVRCVAGVERVVRRLAALRESADTAVLAKRLEPITPPGEELVYVTLVADIPDDPVLGRVESAQQSDREFHDAEVRSEMAAGLGDRLHQTDADLGGERIEALPIEDLEFLG
jgi:hypothetical protein